MQHTVPFYSQAWELEQWTELGFSSQEEAAYWERSSCGILCLKMAIDALRLQRQEQFSPSIREYIRTGLELKAYTDERGWDHGGLIRLARHYGAHATRETSVSLTQLTDWVRQGCIPLVSVKWGFETTKSLKERLLFWKKYGGHIAVVVGFEPDDCPNSILVHHTSKRTEGNWMYRPIPFDTFKASFTGRCILVQSLLESKGV